MNVTQAPVPAPPPQQSELVEHFVPGAEQLGGVQLAVLETPATLGSMHPKCGPPGGSTMRPHEPLVLQQPLNVVDPTLKSEQDGS